MRLYLLPFAGGSARSYGAWPEALSEIAEAVPLDTPDKGRTYLDTPETLSIEEMGARIASQISSETKPYALFGHSMGALMAFEAVRALIKRKARLPRLMIVSAHRAPHQPLDRRMLHPLSDNDFDAELATYSGTPKEVLENSEMMDFVRPTLRRDFRACETYRYSEDTALPVPLASIGGIDDPEVSAEDLEAWARHSRHFLGSRTLPGGHFYFQNALSSMTSEIERLIAEAGVPA